MPQTDPAEYEALSLEAFGLVRGFPLHDVWLVELEGTWNCTVQDLRELITAERIRDLGPIVRALFSFRILMGRAFGLDSAKSDVPVRSLLDQVPPRLVNASTVPAGTREGPFETLYVLPNEAAYQVINATVHAIVVVALIRSVSGHRLLWATHVRPVGWITSLYMRLIDPFRRMVVYPGLESWLKRLWQDDRLTAGNGTGVPPVTGRGSE